MPTSKPEPEELGQVKPGRRSTRPSALKACAANKKLAAQGLLNIKSEVLKGKHPKTKLATHAWNYDEYCQLVDNSDHFYYSTKCIPAPDLLPNLSQEAQDLAGQLQAGLAGIQLPDLSRPTAASSPGPRTASDATTPPLPTSKPAPLVVRTSLATSPLLATSLIPRPLLLAASRAARITSQTSLSMASTPTLPASSPVFSSSTSHAPGLNAPSSGEDAGSQSDLVWDHSPEQLAAAAGETWQEQIPQAMGALTEEDERQFHNATAPRHLYSSSTSYETITSSSQDDEVFNDFPTPRTTNNTRLQRTGAFRRRRPALLPQPTSPSNVVTWETQNLEQVLLPQRPLVPEAVPLGPVVVDLTRALSSMQGPSLLSRRMPLSPVQQQLLNSPGPVLRSRVQQLEFEAEPAAQLPRSASAPTGSRAMAGLRTRSRVDYKALHEGHK